MEWWEELNSIMNDRVPDRERDEKHKNQVRKNWHNKKEKYMENRRKADEEKKRTFG